MPALGRLSWFPPRRGHHRPASDHPFCSLRGGAPVQEVHYPRHEAITLFQTLVHPPAPSHPPREPVVRDVVHNCCILLDSRYMYAVAPLRNLRRLRATLNAVSNFLHLIVVPPTMNIEIDRSLYEVVEPGANVLSRLHRSPLDRFSVWSPRCRRQENGDIVSVKMRGCHGGAITVNVKDIPMGAHGLDVTPPRYPPFRPTHSVPWLFSQPSSQPPLS